MADLPSTQSGCPQCGASDEARCVGEPGCQCFLRLAQPLVAERDQAREACDAWIVAKNSYKAERDRYREALEEIADGPDRHNAVRSIKTAKRALGHRASP